MMNQYSDQKDQNQPTDNQQEAQQEQVTADSTDPSGQQSGQMDQTGQAGSSPLDGLRQQAQGEVNTTIDQIAGRVPGGQQYAQQAKDASSGELDALEHAVEGKLGGLFGHGHPTQAEEQ